MFKKKQSHKNFNLENILKWEQKDVIGLHYCILFFLVCKKKKQKIQQKKEWIDSFPEKFTCGSLSKDSLIYIVKDLQLTGYNIVNDTFIKTITDKYPKEKKNFNNFKKEIKKLNEYIVPKAETAQCIEIQDAIKVRENVLKSLQLKKTLQIPRQKEHYDIEYFCADTQGFENPGNYCWMNACLQVLLQIFLFPFVNRFSL